MRPVSFFIADDYEFYDAATGHGNELLPLVQLELY